MSRTILLLSTMTIAVLAVALGAGFFDSNVGIAKARKCPQGSTSEKVEAVQVCTTTWVGTSSSDAHGGSNDPRIIEKMYGQGGNDRLAGYGGEDGISGGSGQDTLWGGQGDDGLFGDSGRDTIYGGPGGDEIYATKGGDTVYAGPGNDDVVDAQNGKRDKIFCGSGRDYASVDKRDDTKDCESVEFPSLLPVPGCIGCKPSVGSSFWEQIMGPP